MSATPQQSAPVAGGAPEARTCAFLPSVAPADERPCGAENSYALLAATTARVPAADCLGWRPPVEAGAAAAPEQSAARPYVWWSYADVLAMATAVGVGLVETCGLEKGDRVGVYAKNCPWWSLTMYACVSQGLVVVPIYDTLGPNIVEYVCNHAGTKVVVVSAENAPKLACALPKCPTVAAVVVVEADGARKTGTAATAAVAAATAAGFAAVPMAAVLEAGEEKVRGGAGADTAGWEDTYCLMYTSGTTGDPKGVVLSNRAIMSSVASAYTYFAHHGQTFVGDDSILSYLPLSHIFEQQSHAMFIGCGGKVGFYSGDVKLLLDDLSALKPTVFIGVPRVYARFQERIKAGVEAGGFIKRKLYEFGYARQLTAEKAPVGPAAVGRSGLWDALVFSKVRAKILPNVRLCVTGSAPLSEETNDFLKVNLVCPIVQGYGLTETVGGMVCSTPGASASGTCGGPLPGVEVKLVDLPDMGYMTADKPHPRGEVCVRGSIVTTGYYKDPEATAAAFDADGFFKTGDVGMWTDDGALKIIDRAKNLFKLSQGEYVSPEAIENELSKAKLVGQIYVYGNSLQSTLLAVVVPDVPAAKAWASEGAPGTTDVAAIGALPAFKKALLAELTAAAQDAKLKKYEWIQDAVIETGDLNELGQGFHVDNNLTTPTFKLKRPQLQKKYKPALDAMYAAMK